MKKPVLIIIIAACIWLMFAITVVVLNSAPVPQTKAQVIEETPVVATIAVSATGDEVTIEVTQEITSNNSSTVSITEEVTENPTTEAPVTTDIPTTEPPTPDILTTVAETTAADPIVRSLNLLGFNSAEDLFTYFNMFVMSPNDIQACPGEPDACVRIVRPDNPFTMTNVTLTTFDGQSCQANSSGIIPGGPFCVYGVTIRPFLKPAGSDPQTSMITTVFAAETTPTLPPTTPTLTAPIPETTPTVAPPWAQADALSFFGITEAVTVTSCPGEQRCFSVIKRDTSGIITPFHIINPTDKWIDGQLSNGNTGIPPQYNGLVLGATLRP
ncbi:hypothetical protein HGA88_02255 [Candidatus Roizmanbacteria bacterium]|nr:hypothetical protein [Candidatus Roizmanbacteria bacterium]